MKYFLLLLTIITVKANGQSAEETVKKPINQLFEGMRTSDSNMIKSAFAPQAFLQTVARNKEGKTVVHSTSVQDFVAAVSKPHADVYDERITFDLIRIDGNLAIAWTPYKFYIGDKFSHCGVNSFQLVQLDGVWKIQYIIDTRRRDNCH